MEIITNSCAHVLVSYLCLCSKIVFFLLLHVCRGSIPVSHGFILLAYLYLSIDKFVVVYVCDFVFSIGFVFLYLFCNFVFVRFFCICIVPVSQQFHMVSSCWWRNHVNLTNLLLFSTPNGHSGSQSDPQI